MNKFETLRALVFDLDGTLAESKSSMTKVMGNALSVLMKKIPIAIISGGSFPQFEKQLLPFFPPSTSFQRLSLFPTSGSSCYLFENGVWRTHYNHTLSNEERTRILSAFDEALQETAFLKPEKIWGSQIEDRGSQITFSALGQDAPVEEKRRFDPDRRKRSPLQVSLQKRLPGFSVRVNAHSSIDITREGIDKAYGVKRFSEILAVPVSEMLYVGDALFPGGNDEIVKEAGIPTQSVANPEETLDFIRHMIAILPS